MEGESKGIAVFWFRRDLRLDDNCGLFHALNSGYKVLPLFIYDSEILKKLERDDPRMDFLGKTLGQLNMQMAKAGSSLLTLKGTPPDAFKKVLSGYNVKALYFNRDYEPAAIMRDRKIESLFRDNGIPCFSFKDHVILEMSEVTKNDGKPYTVYTPYSKKWLALFRKEMIKAYPSGDLSNNFLATGTGSLITPHSLGFKCPQFNIRPPVLDKEHISLYDRTRDIPSAEGTSYLGPHLRFGTLSIRKVLRETIGVNHVFVKELIWREFFIQILWHFPQVETSSFRKQYDSIEWINNEELFTRWCNGKTGFPIVDAGMRELKETGYMHNRVRMIAANFLTRYLLTDWRWGEAWFASKLLDYELSSNNGNWQWAAGTGCDAAPYFRIFNPETQAEKFDPGQNYIRKWIPEYGTPLYPHPLTDHRTARERALKHYRDGIRII